MKHSSSRTASILCEQVSPLASYLHSCAAASRQSDIIVVKDSPVVYAC